MFFHILYCTILSDHSTKTKST